MHNLISTSLSIDIFIRTGESGITSTDPEVLPKLALGEWPASANVQDSPQTLVISTPVDELSMSHAVWIMDCSLAPIIMIKAACARFGTRSKKARKTVLTDMSWPPMGNRLPVVRNYYDLKQLDRKPSRIIFVTAKSINQQGNSPNSKFYGRPLLAGSCRLLSKSQRLDWRKSPLYRISRISWLGPQQSVARNVYPAT